MSFYQDLHMRNLLALAKGKQARPNQAMFEFVVNVLAAS